MKLRVVIGSRRITSDPECAQRLPLRKVASMEDSRVSAAGDKSKKRGPQGVLENHKDKRLKMDNNNTSTSTSSAVKLHKMDPTEKVQCLAILKTLMAHKDGLAFLEPVDPVKLRIPNYFRIISHPMDLGTIKSKLDKNMYLGGQEFAADVRLTFSNAMLYNPVSNVYHQMAENLSKIFEMRWQNLHGKFNHGSSKVEPGKPSSSGPIKQAADTRQNYGRTPPLKNMWVTERSIQQKVRPFGASNGDAGLLKTAKNCNKKLVAKSSNRAADSGSRKQSSGSINVNQPSSRAWKKCDSCGSIVCQCRLPSEHSTQPNANANASSRDYTRKSFAPSKLSKSDVESDGATSGLDDENISPNRAIRTATLRVRYADLICKAENKKFLDHCDKSDPQKMRLEKARLEQRLREEKARAESEIRAAEAAKQMEAELEAKQQRERLREEARIAVEKVTKTVEIQTAPEIVHEIDRLAWLSQVRSPLEQLGLTLKAEYADGDDDSVLYEEREEGEIDDDSILYEREEGEIY